MSKDVIFKTVGWDIGGAHLKAVLLDSEKNILKALQLPCELWRGLDRLEAAIHQRAFPNIHARCQAGTSLHHNWEVMAEPVTAHLFACKSEDDKWCSRL